MLEGSGSVHIDRLVVCPCILCSWGWKNDATSTANATVDCSKQGALVCASAQTFICQELRSIAQLKNGFCLLVTEMRMYKHDFVSLQVWYTTYTSRTWKLESPAHKHRELTFQWSKRHLESSSEMNNICIFIDSGFITEGEGENVI